MPKMLKVSSYIIAVLAIGVFIGCHQRKSSLQLLTGHTETAPGQQSEDDDLEDHCFRQKDPQDGQEHGTKDTNALVLTIPADGIQGYNPDKLSFRLFNLNSAAGDLPKFDEVKDIKSTPEKQADGSLIIRITHIHVDRDRPITTHLGPGPYMAVASMPATAKNVDPRPLTLFYYYETYAKDLGECAKYREK